MMGKLKDDDEVVLLGAEIFKVIFWGFFFGNLKSF